MGKKFDIVDFSGSKAERLAEIMSNKTCKKILDYLKEKEASETDISKGLNIPLSTVHYNLQKLIENKLVEIKDFYWSDKGNKVNIYKASNKTFIFTPKKTQFLESRLAMIFSLAMIVLILFAVNIVYFYPKDSNQEIQISGVSLPRFNSGDDLIKAFSEASNRYVTYATGGTTTAVAGSLKESSLESVDYSETNIQVEGVDEADIVKTDGKYIYTLAQGNLIIVKSYPADEAEILSTLRLGEFSPEELFIHENKLLIFGSANYNFEEELGEQKKDLPYLRYVNVMSIRLYDISDKKNPGLLRTVDFEGSYLTSRKIGSDVYFVVNSYPHYYEEAVCEEIVPLYRESANDKQPKLEDMKPITECTNIGYIEPIQAQNFITIASISMTDKNKAVEKEVIVGSGQNVYASLENLYIAQTSWPTYSVVGKLKEDSVQKTIITKFELDNSKIEFKGTGEVKGHILNQFSMDEYKDNFRIATTTIGEVWDRERKSINNIYVLDEELKIVGELEGLAPGEKIYSVRFMGKKGYVVTFKKIDPLFVIDLSDPENPVVLGKLKIPGYSDYLHPYDENHIIGIGKETVEAEESLKEGKSLDFAWYQGVKMAIFDVSDVENPIELHKVVIGDRGTDSPVLRDHKAFLFDKEKKLLVIPITLAEIKGEKTRDNQYGDYIFQGAYVYDISLENGFDLKGKITHYEDDKEFKKSGYYFRGTSEIKRSLYIDNILYTISQSKIKLNSLKDLDEIKELVFT